MLYSLNIQHTHILLLNIIHIYKYMVFHTYKFINENISQK